jgi:hypothetical protein
MATSDTASEKSVLSLSTLELIRIVDSVFSSLSVSSVKGEEKAYETFVEELMSPGNKMLIPNIYNRWEGIDSQFCVVLIHYAMEYTKGRMVSLPSFKKQTIVPVLIRVYNHYSGVCQSARFPFVPCIKGLATILSKGKGGRR